MPGNSVGREVYCGGGLRLLAKDWAMGRGLIEWRLVLERVYHRLRGNLCVGKESDKEQRIEEDRERDLLLEKVCLDVYRIKLGIERDL
jgi:hypothetical protein